MDDTFPAVFNSPTKLACLTQGEWVVPLGNEQATIRNIAYGRLTTAPGSIAVMKAPKTNFGLTPAQLSSLRSNFVAAIGVDAKAPIPDLPYLKVPDPVAAMRFLAARAREDFSGKVIAVTGSAGKSSTSDMLARMFQHLEGEDKVAITEKNENLILGIMRSLCNLDARKTRLVLEIAAYHAKTCAAVARPDVAVFTNLSEAHLELFGSLEAIADRKCMIFYHMTTNHAVVICRDMVLFDRVYYHAIESGAHMITYGKHPDADLRLINYDIASGKLHAEVFGEPVEYFFGPYGEHLAVNSLGALAAVRVLGDDWRVAAQKLATWAPLGGRGAGYTLKLPDGGEVRIIDDSFNAAPIAMRAGLRMLAQTSGKRRIAVLGEMLELGPEGDRIHFELGELVAGLGIDKVYALGDAYYGFWSVLPEKQRGERCENVEQLTTVLRRDFCDGDTVFFKGSHGSNLYKVVDTLKVKCV